MSTLLLTVLSLDEIVSAINVVGVIIVDSLDVVVGRPSIGVVTDLAIPVVVCSWIFVSYLEFCTTTLSVSKERGTSVSLQPTVT